MTAGIAVLDKSAVALAADSAVTRGYKVYNTANKLFMLSKYHPVGIMIYGSAEFIDIPWETIIIIKEYRRQLGAEEFDRLEEYGDNFIKFLESDRITSAENRKRSMVRISGIVFPGIATEIISKLPPNGRGIETIVNTSIRDYFERIKSNHGLEIIEDYIDKILKEFGNILSKKIEDILGPFSLSKEAKETGKKICAYLYLSMNSSGVVIAGFGNKDISPSVFSFYIGALIGDKLDCKNKGHEKIEVSNSAIIKPFAQKGMVQAFMNGIHPDFHKKMMSAFYETFENIHNSIIEGISELDNNRKNYYKNKLYFNKRDENINRYKKWK